MPQSEIVENVRNLLLSHAGRDPIGFRRSAEAIIQELAVSNRPSEAKFLRDALKSVSLNAEITSLGHLDKRAQGLISFISPIATGQLFFSGDTQSRLERVISEYRCVRQLAESGLRPKTRLLFWGPPGCGKTAGAQWLASELSIPFGVVHLGTLITSFVGETGSNIQKVLAVAEQRPMVLLLDEADAIAKARDDNNDVGELRRVVNALLQGLDGVSLQNSVVVLASNHSHLFDAAVWRRFDDVIAFPPPQYAERLSQLKHLTSGLKLKGSLAGTARELTNFTFAEIERAVLEVAKSMVLEKQELVSTSNIVMEARSWRRRMKAAATHIQIKKRR